MCVAVALLLANPLSGILLEKLGAQLLGCFYLAIILLAGISLSIARGLLLKKWFVVREKI
jgi:hypothetical protein